MKLVCVGKVNLPYPFRDEQQLSALYQVVAEHCERLDVVGMAAGDSAGHEEMDGRIHIHAGPSGDGVAGHWHFLRYALATIRQLEATVQPDVYWVSDPLDSALVGWYARRVSGAPVVVQVLGDMYKFSPSRFNLAKRAIIGGLTTWSTSWADRVRIISFDMRDQLLRRGVSPDRMSYVTMRTDFGLFDPAKHDDAGRALRASWGWQDKQVACYTGAVQPTKGTDLLVEAMVALRDALPDLRLVLLGDGPDLAALKARAAACGVAERIRFEGWQPYNLLPAYYAASDVSVVPSRDEGLGRGGIQAAAMALPSVMTRVGGNPEVIVDGRSGWLVNPTIEGVADGLRTFAATPPDALAAMGDYARRYAASRYAFEPVVKQMIDELLYRVVHEHPRPARASRTP